MHKFIFIAVVVFQFSFSSKQEEKNTIVWKEGRPLNWNDFRGEPQKRFAAASTVYKIEKTITKTNNGATIKIEAIFFCKDSWKKEEWISESVLTHEQKHFDIVELFSRKLRRLIKEQSYSSYSDVEQKVENLYKQIDKEMDAYQAQYDDKTDSSMDGGKQREWNKKVLSELNALNNYSSPIVQVTL